MRFLKKCAAAAALILGFSILLGCGSITTSEAKLADLDFTVVSETNIQEDIKELIEEKKEN